MDTSSIDHLPDEIIELILSRSPGKSVGRFKSVSKSWQSIISNPRFSRIHHIQQSKLSENQNKFLFWMKLICFKYVSRYPLYMKMEDGKFPAERVLDVPSEDFSPLSSCYGLILCVDHKDDEEYMLWNPLIKKHIVISAFSPEIDPEADTYPHPCLHHLYFDSITDDYKIVFAYENFYTAYSCKNGSWGEVTDIPRDLSELECEACVDGCFYYKRNGEILFLDARDGKLHEFPPPNDVNGLVEVELEEVSERLCLCRLSEDRRRLQLWVMEKNEGSFEKSWRKLISMEKEEADLCDLSPICLSNKDDVVLSTTIPKDDNENFKHFLYNPREKSFREIKFVWGEYSAYFFPYSENVYMPSSNIC